MKTVKYDGEDTRVMPSLGVVVSNGDVVEVPDDFDEFNFSDTKDPASIKVIVPPTEIPAPTINEPIVNTKDAGAIDANAIVASSDKASAGIDTEKGV